MWGRAWIERGSVWVHRRQGKMRFVSDILVSDVFITSQSTGRISNNDLNRIQPNDGPGTLDCSLYFATGLNPYLFSFYSLQSFSSVFQDQSACSALYNAFRRRGYSHRVNGMCFMVFSRPRPEPSSSCVIGFCSEGAARV